MSTSRELWSMRQEAVAMVTRIDGLLAAVGPIDPHEPRAVPSQLEFQLLRRPALTLLIGSLPPEPRSHQIRSRDRAI